jgi:cytochrome P450
MSSPVIYRTAKKEIKDGIAAGRISDPITNEEAQNLEYMQAVLKEGLRLMVPVNFGFPKRVPASGDTICGTFVPGGTDVYPNYGSLMRNRDVFGEDADTFRPERFLGGGPNIARMAKTVDFAFGYGRTMCLGKSMALIELNKIFVEVSINTGGATTTFPPHGVTAFDSRQEAPANYALTAIKELRLSDRKPGAALEAEGILDLFDS